MNHETAGWTSRLQSLLRMFRRSPVGIVLACIVCSAWGGSVAEAEAPPDLDSLVLQARREGRLAKGVVPLLLIAREYDRADAAAVREALTDLSKDTRLDPARRVLASRLLARALERAGDVTAASALRDSLGYVTQFRVVGPFDNEGKLGFATEMPPERDRMQAPDLMATFEGKERPVGWRTLPPALAHRGIVPLGNVWRPTQQVCGFAETFVNSTQARTLSLWFGAGGASQVYWNGRVVLQDEAYRTAAFADRQAVFVNARRGWNRLLVKECVAEEHLGFYLRLGDVTGAPVTDLQVATETTEALDIPASPAGAARVVPAAPLPSLIRAAEAVPRSAQAKIDLARYLQLTRADDQAVHRGRQLAAEAAGSAHAQLDWLLLAADLAGERGEKMRFLSLAENRFGTTPQWQLARAAMESSGPQPEAALPWLERISGADKELQLAAQRIRAGVLRELGLNGARYRLFTQLRARFGDRVVVLRGLLAAAADAGHVDEAMALRQELLKVRYDDIQVRRVLIADALHRGQTAQVAEHLDVVRRLQPGDPQTLLYLARMYDAIGRDDLALGVYQDAMTYVPESVKVRFAYARAMLRAEQPELSEAALREVLRLSPQHAEARELLDHLQPGQRRDEAYAATSEEFLPRRSDGGGHSVTVLHQLQVNTVFDNGLGARFSQYVAQAHDDEGARNLRTYAIQFDPQTQRVDLRMARVYRHDGGQLESIRAYEQQLGEPWYRIYYDTRALTVVFPDLQPGDVVELRYRVDDIAQRNLFADYFGDLHPLAGFSPIVRHEYVLITPKQRKFFTNRPIMPGLTETVSEEGDTRTQRWVVTDVPALVAEGDMPGLTEISPYLHVSTYRTWEEVGRWYWGLIHDQLYADRFLKDKVAELIAGKVTTEEKVRAIHDWVIEHTRYVGLEFGIHGFLPYRVPLIVQRGFGDCKDKASLLYTMFREAGIEARIVLVRTRRNGQISDLPASLSVFDHAIAYVPELDLFIDGTAEHSGVRELPTQDQGVTVLIVGPDSARLSKTPVLQPDADERSRNLQVTLAQDGSAAVAGQEVVDGTEAASYRAYYEAAGTRQERFSRSLSKQYPGLQLHSLGFSDLDDVDAPVRYDYRFSAPRFAEQDGQTLRVAPSSLGSLVRRLARTAMRNHPLDLQSRSTYREERTIYLPDGFVAQVLPAGGEVVSPFFRLSLRFSQQGRAVVAKTEFVVTEDRVAPSEYPEFRSRVQEAERLLRQRIGIGKVQP